MARTDPLRKFRFRLEIDGLEQAAFSEVTIGDLASDPIECREGDARITVRKLFGLTTYANVTLKWGITNSLELAGWHQLVVGGATLQDDIGKGGRHPGAERGRRGQARLRDHPGVPVQVRPDRRQRHRQRGGHRHARAVQRGHQTDPVGG